MNDREKQQEGAVGDFFSWIGSKMKALLGLAQPEVVVVFKQFVTTFEGDAIAAVAEEAKKVTSGEEKFASAVSVVTAKVIAAGWSASNTAVRTLVQDAYTAWKASQKPVAGELLVKAPQ
jgi:hypothetical protein